MRADRCKIRGGWLSGAFQSGTASLLRRRCRQLPAGTPPPAQVCHHPRRYAHRSRVSGIASLLLTLEAGAGTTCLALPAAGGCLPSPSQHCQRRYGSEGVAAGAAIAATDLWIRKVAESVPASLEDLGDRSACAPPAPMCRCGPARSSLLLMSQLAPRRSPKPTSQQPQQLHSQRQRSAYGDGPCRGSG